MVDVESLGNDYSEDEYSRLNQDLGLPKETLKLVKPRLEQMRTVNNHADMSVDDHMTIINADDADKLEEAQEESHFQTPALNLKKYSNPNQLDMESTWLLFEIKL